MAKPKYDVGYRTRLPIERCTHPDDYPITNSKVCAVLAYRRGWNEERECWETLPPLTPREIKAAEIQRAKDQRDYDKTMEGARKKLGMKRPAR